MCYDKSSDRNRDGNCPEQSQAVHEHELSVGYIESAKKNLFSIYPEIIREISQCLGEDPAHLWFPDDEINYFLCWYDEFGPSLCSEGGDILDMCSDSEIPHGLLLSGGLFKSVCRLWCGGVIVYGLHSVMDIEHDQFLNTELVHGLCLDDEIVHGLRSDGENIHILCAGQKIVLSVRL